MPNPGPTGDMPDTLQQFVTETNGISTHTHTDHDEKRGDEMKSDGIRLDRNTHLIGKERGWRILG